MESTWVVVADRNCATIYSVPRGMARLRKVRELQHRPASIYCDACDAGAGESCLPDQALSTADQQARSFAAHVAGHVEDGCRAQWFDELILVAAPGFLPYLRESLSDEARQAVVAEVAKNLVGAQQEKLQEQVLRVL